MTEAQIALARRAVAAPGWRWLPGMQAWRPDCPPIRLVHIEDAGNALQEHDWLPDLSDPLTALGLLALVRERWKMPHLTVTRKNRWWTYRECAGVSLELHRICAPTETEALIAALEVAP